MAAGQPGEVDEHIKQILGLWPRALPSECRRRDANCGGQSAQRAPHLKIKFAPSQVDSREKWVEAGVNGVDNQGIAHFFMV